MPEIAGLDQFWRCSVCGGGIAMGVAKFTKPPTCGNHGEMEQTTAQGFATDFNRRDDEEAA